MKNRKGNRKPTAHEQRTRRFELRLSEAERTQFLELEQSLGISRADIVRIRVLQHSKKMLVNTSEMMKLLDSIGTELGRSGNNINQLARHANILNRQQRLDPGVVAEFNALFTEYIRTQRELEKTLRQLLRTMK